MNSLILVSLILSVLLGIFRGIDLTFWTDAETGLCVVGTVLDEEEVCIALVDGRSGLRGGRDGAGRGGRSDIRPAAQHRPGQPIARQRQSAAQHEEQGTEEQKGFFH